MSAPGQPVPPEAGCPPPVRPEHRDAEAGRGERTHSAFMRATPAGAEIAKLEEAVNLREQVSMRAWARTADLTKQYGVDLNEVRREPSAMRSREPG